MILFGRLTNNATIHPITKGMLQKNGISSMNLVFVYTQYKREWTFLFNEPNQNENNYYNEVCPRLLDC
jgi:hypothetical protein